MWLCLYVLGNAFTLLSFAVPKSVLPSVLRVYSSLVFVSVGHLNQPSQCYNNEGPLGFCMFMFTIVWDRFCKYLFEHYLHYVATSIVSVDDIPVVLSFILSVFRLH